MTDLEGRPEADVERLLNGGYVCRSCQRVVDPDQEPSPGESIRCPDCWSDWVREGWGAQ